MGELRPEHRVVVREAMARPDEAVPFQYESPEAVLAPGTQYGMADFIYGIRENLTPDQEGGPGGVDIEVVYLAACYHLARCRNLPEDQATWDRHAFTFLFGVVHALRPEAVPEPLRGAFAEKPPPVVAPFEIVHVVGLALLVVSAPAKDEGRLLLATALIGWAHEQAQGSASEPYIAFNYGTALASLADLDGADADADTERTRAAGLHFMRAALAALPDGDPARQEMMARLMLTQAKAPPVPVPEGSMLAEVAHSMRDGDLDGLDRIIGRLRSVVGAPTTGEPDRSHRRVELGQVLRMRFEMEGELADLDGSIAELTEALAGTLGDEVRAAACSFLGLAHLDRYVCSDDLADLEAATAAVRHPCIAKMAASAAHGQRLTNLAAVLTARFRVYGVTAELDEAVDHLGYAVAATPPAQPDRPVMMIKLAVALRERGTHTDREADLDTAEAILRQVAGEPSDTGHNHQLARLELGDLLYRRGMDRGATVDLAGAVEQYRTTALAPRQDVRTRLHSAARWGVTCATLGDLDQARTAFGVALGDLLPKLAGSALGRESQEVRLGEVPSLANVAASVEIRAGRPREALIRLEQGRGVLLAQALRLRGRHDDLIAVSPELAGRYEQVCAELVALQRGPEQRKASAAEFDQVVREIRALPGFDRFHMPPDWAQLSEAAEHGPVAVINVSPLGCDALLLHRPFGRSVVEVLPLPGVTREGIDRRTNAFQTSVAKLSTPGTTGRERRAHDLEMKRTLRWLGEEIVEPVLDRLGLDRPAGPGEPLPRLWWCPTGALSLLPLHAAQLAGNGGSGPVYAHDRVVSSYVPTLGSLLHARGTPSHEAGRTSLAAVAVDAMDAMNAMDPGDAYPRLAALDDELAATDQLPGSRSELRHADATPEAVLAALRAHTHAHLACHGVRDPEAPSNSRLLLRGGDLTVRELAAERLPNAEFAYLSACHSAAPGEKLADEVISVASAFQLCGYRQVIGSLWTVEDRMGPLLTREVYRLLGAADTPGAAYALHRAVGVLREHPRYREPLFWASVIHSGP